MEVIQKWGSTDWQREVGMEAPIGTSGARDQLLLRNNWKSGNYRVTLHQTVPQRAE